MKREIDLSGPDGNAFVLFGMARQWSKDLGLDGDAIIADMQSDDYKHLLNVFEEHFGEFVELLNHPYRD